MLELEVYLYGIAPSGEENYKTDHGKRWYIWHETTSHKFVQAGYTFYFKTVS